MMRWLYVLVVTYLSVRHAADEHASRTQIFELLAGQRSGGDGDIATLARHLVVQPRENLMMKKMRGQSAVQSDEGSIRRGGESMRDAIRGISASIRCRCN